MIFQERFPSQKIQILGKDMLFEMKNISSKLKYSRS